MATKKTSKRTKTTKKTGEALRQEALKEAEANVAKLEADERAAKTTKKARGTKRPGSKKAASKQRVAKPATTKKRSGLDIAFEALKAFGEPMNAKQIAERAIAAGWKTSGATPHATLYAAMIREIAAKGRDARFRKTDRGLFTAGKGARA